MNISVTVTRPTKNLEVLTVFIDDKPWIKNTTAARDGTSVSVGIPGGYLSYSKDPEPVEK